MILKSVNRKVRLYKKFEVDIWGFNLVGLNKTSKNLKILKNLFPDRNINNNSIIYNDKIEEKSMYIYRIDMDELDVFIKKQKWKFLSRRVSKLFFLTLSYKQFSKLFYKASKMDGFKESNYIMLIENRLFSMLYRMHFISNIFSIRSFILNKNVYLNKRIVTFPNMKVWYGDILQLDSLKSKIIKLDLIKRFVLSNMYFSVPNYMFVSYKLMFGFVYKEPLMVDITYPNDLIDIYRVADVL